MIPRVPYPPVEDYVYNFAFGANLYPPDILHKRVKVPGNDATKIDFNVFDPVEYESFEPAMVSDHRLAFTCIGLPPTDPAFASIEPAAGSEIHGTLIRLTRENFIKLAQSECIEWDPPPYVLYPVKAKTYGGKVFEAISFRSNPAVYPEGLELNPSEQYHGRILDGARKVGLQKSHLDVIESYTPTPNTSASMKTACMAVFQLGRKLRANGGAVIVDTVFGLVTYAHEWRARRLNSCNSAPNRCFVELVMYLALAKAWFIYKFAVMTVYRSGRTA